MSGRKPKFQVGQKVLRWDGTRTKVLSIVRSRLSHIRYWYYTGNGYVSGENALRPVSARERGKR
jgi:hypothetical protein